MQAEAALALEFERLYLRLSSAFVSQAAMCSGGKACGVTQAAAGDRILTFNDVLAIARAAGLLKVQSLRAGFGRGGMVQTGRDAWAGRVRAEASLYCIRQGNKEQRVTCWQVSGDDGLNYTEHRCNDDSQVRGRVRAASTIEFPPPSRALSRQKIDVIACR